MNSDTRRPAGLQEELEGPDEAGHTTALTGAGGGGDTRGDALDDARRDLDADADPTPAGNDESVVGVAGSGGTGPGFVAPPPGEDWPDPMGGDDEERELQRRTR